MLQGPCSLSCTERPHRLKQAVVEKKMYDFFLFFKKMAMYEVDYVLEFCL